MKLRQTFTILLLAALGLAPCDVAGQADSPRATISNGIVQATLYLPNSERGYYRGSRFDWSGVIASLDYNHHSFFGVWFPHYDPRLHDAISGPVEEFRPIEGPEGGLGYTEAKPGGHFLKIGVGLLRKPDDAPYDFSRTYDIVNPGMWTSRPGNDSVQFQQDLKDDSGYGYRYQKTVRLVRKRPELVLEHRLSNTGTRVIETDVYDHDFYVIDAMPTGPDVTVKFTYPPKAKSALKGLAAIHGNELHYLKTLEEGESAYSFLTGFGSSVKDNDIRVENVKAGVGVRETGDHPLVGVNFWSIRSTVCPEAYIHLRIEPKQTVKWTIRFTFYSLSRS